MSTARKISVLIVDDSLVFREVLARGLSADSGIQVVGTASDAFDASEKIMEFQPDVLTIDVEMPKMSGLEFIRRLLPQYPVPIVVVSGDAANVLEALNAGAVDFISKPEVKNPAHINSFINELIVKIKIASIAKVGHLKGLKSGDNSNVAHVKKSSGSIIAIGASTGGTEATLEVLKQFPSEMPGIVIVQHMPPVFTRMYSERLNNICHMRVKEAEDGDRVENGRVLIAPGDYHMKIQRDSSGYYVKCFKGERVNGHCPSVDILFNSVAEVVGKDAIGIILTGMGNDGAKGLLEMRKKGAFTVGQDEKTCVVYGMPMVAFNIGAVMKQSDLNHIHEVVLNAVNSR